MFFELTILSYRSAYAVKMAKELSVKTEDKNLNDCDDTSSSQNSSLPHEQEQSVKTSISIGSVPQGQVNTSFEDKALLPNYMASDKA